MNIKFSMTLLFFLFLSPSLCAMRNIVKTFEMLSLLGSKKLPEKELEDIIKKINKKIETKQPVKEKYTQALKTFLYSGNEIVAKSALEKLCTLVTDVNYSNYTEIAPRALGYIFEVGVRSSNITIVGHAVTCLSEIVKQARDYEITDRALVGLHQIVQRSDKPEIVKHAVAGLFAILAVEHDYNDDEKLSAAKIDGAIDILIKTNTVEIFFNLEHKSAARLLHDLLDRRNQRLFIRLINLMSVYNKNNVHTKINVFEVFSFAIYSYGDNKKRLSHRMKPFFGWHYPIDVYEGVSCETVFVKAARLYPEAFARMLDIALENNCNMKELLTYCDRCKYKLSKTDSCAGLMRFSQTMGDNILHNMFNKEYWQRDQALNTQRMTNLEQVFKLCIYYGVNLYGLAIQKNHLGLEPSEIAYKYVYDLLLGYLNDDHAANAFHKVMSHEHEAARVQQDAEEKAVDEKGAIDAKITRKLQRELYGFKGYKELRNLRCITTGLT